VALAWSSVADRRSLAKACSSSSATSSAARPGVPEHEVDHERRQGHVETEHDGGDALGRGWDGDLAQGDVRGKQVGRGDALMNRVRLLCAVHTPPMKAKLTK
jgi:hypothetical protein